MHCNRQDTTLLDHCTSSLRITVPVDDSVRFNALDLMLVHNAESAISDCAAISRERAVLPRQVLGIALNSAVDAPYLLDQILALSAFHIVRRQKGPLQSMTVLTTLHRRALELQNRAISHFTRSTVLTGLTRNCLPTFFFAAVLGLYSLSDMLELVRHGVFSEFIDRVVATFRLHHGIRTCMLANWEELTGSEFSSLITMDDHDADVDILGGGTTDCGHLNIILDESVMPPDTLRVCRHAVRCLQSAFDLQSMLSRGNGAFGAGTYSSSHAALAFSVLVGSEYINLLDRRLPEALVILGHYGVLLHRCRLSWIFGDAGRCMVHSVAQQLGSYWGDAMSWPLQACMDETETTDR